MNALRALEGSVKRKKASQVDAVREYLGRIREVRAAELLLGIKPDDSATADLPDLDGLFRYSVVENHLGLVEACLELGANPRDDEHWGLIYPLAFGYPEIVDRVAASIADELPALTDCWAKAVFDGENEASYVLGLLIEVRDRFHPKSISNTDSVLSFDSIPRDEPAEQIELFA